MGFLTLQEAPQSRTSSPSHATAPQSTTATRTAPATPASPTVSARLAARNAATPRLLQDAVKIVVPVRYGAWLNGDMGRALEHRLAEELEPLGEIRITRLPRAFVVEAHEAAGPFLEAVHRAAVELEHSVEATYPVLHHEIGPVWTGTLQAVFA